MSKFSKIQLQSIPQKYTLLLQIVTFLWLSSIFLFSLMSIDPNKPVFPDWKHLDKGVHMAFYFGLQTLGMATEHLRNQRKLNILENSIIAFIVFAIGGLIELLQFALFAERSGEWSDLLANTAGIGLGIMLVQVLLKLFVQLPSSYR